MFRWLLSLFIVCVSTTFALYGSDDSVTQLDATNFGEFVSQPGVKIVKFYASWCGHCEQFAPKFKKAALIFQGIVHFGVVDNEAHPDVGSEYKVEAYPTVLVFRSDKKSSSPIKYTGARTVEGLSEFLMNQIREYVTAIGKKEGVSLNFSPVSSSDDGSGTCGARSDSGSGHKQARDHSDHSKSKDAVISLTDSTFDTLVINSEEDWMVAFIAPWCGHCKNLAPEWRKAAEKLQGKVKVGTVDATVFQSLAGRYDVRGFPTIMYFKGSEKENYNGPRSSESIVEFALLKAETNKPPPEVKEITSDAVLHEACDETQLCVIAFLPHLLDCQSECRRAYLDVLKDAANKHKSKNWGWLWSSARTHKALEESLEVGGFGYPAMVAINMRKQKFALMHGSFSQEGVRSFLYDLSLGRGTIALHSMSNLPEIQSTQPWDGKDAPVVQEEEIDLSELGIKTEL